MLSNHTDFSAILDNVVATGIFRKVYYVDDKKVSKTFISLDKQKRFIFSRNVHDFWETELDVEYTDYYYGHNILANKLYYYYLVKKQGNIVPHSFQEGASSYMADMWKIGTGDCLDHTYYKDKSLLAMIKDMYMYLPDKLLFTSKVPVCPININSDRLREVIKQIYSPPPLPSQQFIYIALCSEYQGVSSNEVEILDKIADIVGKENIAIKNHPRCDIDKYTYRGYYVMDSSIAMEAYMLDPEIKKKILIAPLSTSLISATFLLDDYNAIIIRDLIRCDLSQFINKDSMSCFLKSIADTTDTEDGKICMHYAKDIERFAELIKYLKGCRKLNEQ